MPRHHLFLVAFLLGMAGPSLVASAPARRAAPSAREDFYSYANEAWLATTRLPNGAARIDTTSILKAQNARRVRNLIEEARRDHVRARGDIRKIADYYTALGDGAAIERKGFTPLAQDLAAIAAIEDRHMVAAWLGRTMRLDDGSNQQTESLWGLWVHQGFHDPSYNAAHLVQGGLGLSDISTYLDGGPTATAGRTAYRNRIARTLARAGLDNPQMRSGRVLALEIAIARTHASRADTDDAFKTDNLWNRADFAARAPGIDWTAYFSAAGLDIARGFVVWQPSAVIGGARLVADQPLEAWKDYLAFHIIDHYAAVLPRSLNEGAMAADPADATEAVFGDAIGRLYVERYFPARAKAAATEMVENIRRAYRLHLASARWLSPGTRATALEKLAALKLGLGYPDSWVDYSALAVQPDDAFGNLRRAEAFAYRRELDRLQRPADPAEWAGQLHPQMVGAILAVSPNAMQFSAGLLQPPYFNPDGDAAANYGSAGAGIAHEISHSFDQVGNIYDAQGRLGLWWSEKDLASYAAFGAPLAAQLDGCAPAPGLHTNGRQVLDESIADLTGLAVAFDAYHLSLRGRHDAVRNGLTGDQRFFIAFAERWRRMQTDAALRAQVAGDNHAAPPCRSNLVRNFAPWIDAFGVRSGNAMFTEPTARVQIW
jgi:putative endopeptidase